MAPACLPADCHSCVANVVCHCLNVTEDQVVEAITTLALRTVKDVREHTGAGEGCTACHARLRAFLDQHAYLASSPPICSLK